jgi:DNA-binding protein HU-beta
MAGVSEIASKAGVTSDVAKAVFQAVLGLTKEGQKVAVQGFGSFSKVHKEAYTGRNPGTGEAIEVPAKDKLHFKAASGLDMSVPAPAAGRRRGR